MKTMKGINLKPISQARKKLTKMLETRRPLTQTIRLEQLIKWLTHPSIECLQWAIEYIPKAIESEAWWLSDDEQQKLSSELIGLVQQGLEQIAEGDNNDLAGDSKTRP